jgi:hypothetical protein
MFCSAAPRARGGICLAPTGGLLTGGSSPDRERGGEVVMLRGFRRRWGVAALASGLLWVALVGAGCGSEEDAGSLGNPADEESVSSTESELRRRPWGWRPTTGTTNRPKTDAGTASTPPTGVPAPTAPPPAPMPTPTPMPTPNTGVVDSSNSGGTCPNNRAMPAGGACGPYGVNCTYDDSSGSHYCLCLSSGPTGVQGWSCR